MTAVLSNADSVIREPVHPCTTSLTITFLQIRYIKVHTATRWTIGHDLVLLCFKDLMNVTDKVQFIDQRFDTPVWCLHQGPLNLSYQAQRSWASIFLRHTLASIPTVLPPQAIHRLDEHRNCSSNSSGYCVSATLSDQNSRYEKTIILHEKGRTLTGIWLTKTNLTISSRHFPRY